MAGEEEDDGDDGDKKAKPQSELFQVIFEPDSISQSAIVLVEWNSFESRKYSIIQCYNNW